MLQASSKFVLVPGPGDFGPGISLPRPGLPQAIAAALQEAVPNAVLASNPCRSGWDAAGGLFHGRVIPAGARLAAAALATARRLKLLLPNNYKKC